MFVRVCKMLAPSIRLIVDVRIDDELNTEFVRLMETVGP